MATRRSAALLSLSFIVATVGAGSTAQSCKCLPQDSCWPSNSKWNSLNSTVSGNLIKPQPLALPCYPGPSQDASLCATIDAQWSNADFQANSPVGLSYPHNLTCPPINVTAGQVPGTCGFGSTPNYVVNATKPEHVSSAIDFARDNNVRLVIKNTGHDILGRSEGTGSLEVWLRHLRSGITFNDSFKSSSACKTINWTGSAFVIGGGYTWGDVYQQAKAHNVIVVGGGTPSVGAIGGWMQGGGHGPASHQFGLGADQVLEATVVLANGSVITANACQNQDVFFAIRGGGGGTYGVVTSATVKAWPMVSVTVQHLAMAPLTSNTSTFLDAITEIYSAFPDLSDAGYAGYGSWSIASPTPVFANFTAGYVHGTYMFDKTEKDAVSAFNPVLKKLSPYNMTSLFVSVSYVSYPDYWSFYNTESGVEPPVGSSGAALGSRLFSRASVSKKAALREMIGVIAGTPDQFASNSVEYVAGGQVLLDGADPNSGVNPAWRISYFNNIVARGWADGADAATIASVQNDITNVKEAAMKKVASDTGAYMNEADREDPDWQKDFYGDMYSRLSGVKKKRDPQGVFYCPTCVGSEMWVEGSDGKLCKK